MTELAGIHFSHAGRPILRDFTLRVASGERVVLSGPSGCGKTTILRLIAGFIAPDKGSITIDGHVASSAVRILIPPEKRGLGYVFQDLALWPHMTVFENIEYPLKAGGIPKRDRTDRVQQMLAMTEIPALAARHPSHLSGGEQQRVAIARALVTHPRVILMDEPLSSLDEVLRRALGARIVQLQEQLNFALVYVTHSAEESRMLGARVVELSGP